MTIAHRGWQIYAQPLTYLWGVSRCRWRRGQFLSVTVRHIFSGRRWAWSLCSRRCSLMCTRVSWRLLAMRSCFSLLIWPIWWFRFWTLPMEWSNKKYSHHKTRKKRLKSYYRWSPLPINLPFYIWRWIPVILPVSYIFSQGYSSYFFLIFVHSWWFNGLGFWGWGLGLGFFSWWGKNFVISHTHVVNVAMGTVCHHI